MLETGSGTAGHLVAPYQALPAGQRGCLGWRAATTIDLVYVLAWETFLHRCWGLAHRPTIDLMVDPICQVAQIPHFRSDVFEDLVQEPPDRVRDITDTGMTYVTDQPVSADSYGVHHPTVDLQVQYASSGFVLTDFYSDHPGVLRTHMPDASVAFPGPTCGRAPTVHQVATGVGKYPHPGMTAYLVSHMQYNTISGVIPEKMNSSSDRYRW